MELLATVPLLIIDDLGMRKLGPQQQKSFRDRHCAVTNAPAPW